jgi:hypothetical protein
MRIDYLFPNRINSESNANRFFFNCWTLQTTDNCAFIKKYKCELIIFFSNRNNSESNTNRFFFKKMNRIIFNQIWFEFLFPNRMNSESNANWFFESNANRVFFLWIEPTLHRMRKSIFVLCIELFQNQVRIDFCEPNANWINPASIVRDSIFFLRIKSIPNKTNSKKNIIVQ